MVKSEKTGDPEGCLGSFPQLHLASHGLVPTPLHENKTKQFGIE